MGGHGEGGGVTLGDAGGEVGEEAGAQRVAGVQALHGGQVTGNLCHTLPETQRQEVQSQSVGVEISFPSCSLQHLQMIHSHLQNLCFLQFS